MQEHFIFFTEQHYCNHEIIESVMIFIELEQCQPCDKTIAENPCPFLLNYWLKTGSEGWEVIVFSCQSTIEHIRLQWITINLLTIMVKLNEWQNKIIRDIKKIFVEEWGMVLQVKGETKRWYGVHRYLSSKNIPYDITHRSHIPWRSREMSRNHNMESSTNQDKTIYQHLNLLL